MSAINSLSVNEFLEPSGYRVENGEIRCTPSSWRLIPSCSERDKRVEEAASASEIKMSGVEAFYKKTFKKHNVSRIKRSRLAAIPEAVRKLDALIYAYKIFPHDRARADLLAKHMQNDPYLHHFLRCNFVHVALTSFRAKEEEIKAGRPGWTPPELRVNEDGVEFPIVVDGGKRGFQSWEEFRKRLNSKEEGGIELGDEGDFNGQMMNAWWTYQGIALRPTKELHFSDDKLTQDVSNQVFLELLKSGFIEADMVANSEKLDHPEFSVLVDSKLNKRTTHGVHALFMVSVPSEDGKSLHRFVMGLERAHFAWRTQRGRPSLLDIRHFRTWSGCGDLVRADFKLEGEDLKKVWKGLIDFREGGHIYSQLQKNCCTTVEALLGTLSINFDSKMHIMEYISPSLVPEKGTLREKIISFFVNLFLYFSGGRHSIPGGSPHYRDLSDLFDPEKAYLQSPYKVAQKCEALNGYRKQFGKGFKTEVKKLVPNPKQSPLYLRYRAEIDRASRFAIDPELLPADSGKRQSAEDEKERLNNLVTQRIADIETVLPKKEKGILS